MATIDKQSVRAEFDKIKVGFDEQVKAGKVSTEVAMLVNTLMLLFNLVLSIFTMKIPYLACFLINRNPLT